MHVRDRNDNKNNNNNFSVLIKVNPSFSDRIRETLFKKHCEFPFERTTRSTKFYFFIIRNLNSFGRITLSVLLKIFYK